MKGSLNEGILRKNRMPSKNPTNPGTITTCEEPNRGREAEGKRERERCKVMLSSPNCDTCGLNRTITVKNNLRMGASPPKLRVYACRGRVFKSRQGKNQPQVN